MSETTIKLRAPDGVPERLLLYVGEPLVPDAQVQVVANDPNGTDTTIVLRPAQQGDGVTSHRNAALTGLRVEAILQLPPVPGLRATTTQGVLTVAPIEYTWLNETFTDTNGTAITSHSEGASWLTTASGSATTPTIQTNRLRNTGTTGDDWVGYIDTAPIDEGTYRDITSVFFRRATATGGAANEITEGIAFGLSDYGGGVWEGYVFGWSEADDTWYLKRKTAFAGYSNINSSTTNAFTGTSQSRTLRIVKSNPDASTVRILCYVDGSLVISYDDTDATRIAATGLVGVVFWLSGAVDIDSIVAVEQLVRTAGQQATTSYGAMSAFWYPVPGAYLSPGFRINATAGAVLPTTGSGVNVQLTGQGATTDYEPLGIRLGAGAGSTVGALKPKLTASNIYGAVHYPDYFTNSYYLVDGAHVAIGEVDKFTTTSAFASFASDTGRISPNYLTTYLGLSTALTFPRPTTSKHKYNGEYYTFYPGGGMFSVDENGVRQSAHYRSMPASNTWFTVYPQCVPHYMGWLAWGAPAMYGPELFLGLMNETGDPIDQRSVLGLGIYARSALETVAFHTSRVNPNISGKQAHLVGYRTTTNVASMVAVNGGTGTTELQPARATTTSGSLGILGAPVLVGQRATGNPNTARLVTYTSDDVLALSVSTAKYLDDAFNQADQSYITAGGGRVYPKPNVLCVVPTGYAEKIYAVYVNEPPEAAVPYIGVVVYDMANRTILAHSNTATVGKIDSTSASGFDTEVRQERSVAEVVRLSSGASVTQFIIDKHIVHLSWTSGTVNVPTVTVKTPPAVAGASGSPPEQIIRGWESLAHRGDSAYHVLYRYTFHDTFTTRGYESISKVYVNDATGTSSTWVLTETTNTGGTSGPSGWSEQYIAPTSDGAYNQGINFNAFDANKAWLRAERNYTRGPGDNGDYATVDVDFWDSTFPIFSVQTTGRVGNVRVVVTPYVALTGQRATTNYGQFNDIRSGADRSVKLVRIPSQYRLITTPGICAPVRITFLIDTFTEAGTVNLKDHISDNGVGWSQFTTVGGNFEVQSTVVAMRYDAAQPFQNTIQALADSPNRDYKVVFRWGNGTTTFFSSGEPELAVGVRCPAGSTEGYYFGYNRGDDLWYLVKRFKSSDPESPFGTYVLGTYSESVVPSNIDYSIEVSGDISVKITCRRGPVTVIEYVDDNHDDGNRPLINGFRVNIYGQLPNDAIGPYIDSINASYYEPGALIIDGQRATTAQGALSGPWLLGQRATLAQGIIDPTAVETIVTLTGRSVTTAQGILYPFHGIGVLTGQVATTAYGVVKPPTFVVPAGLRVNVYGGGLEPLTRLLPGLQALAIRGDVYASTESFWPLVGAAAVSTRGALTVGLTTSTLGRVTTLTAGSLSPTVSAPSYSTGAVATTSAGILTPSTAITVALTGGSITTAQGAFTPGSTATRALIGQSITTTPGTLVTTITVTVVGRRATVAGGVVMPLCAVTPLGRSAVCTQGVLQVLTNIFLTGRAGTTAAGVVGQTYGCTLFPTGVQATGYVGYEPTRPNPSTLLWVTLSPEEESTSETNKDEFVVIAPN